MEYIKVATLDSFGKKDFMSVKVMAKLIGLFKRGNNEIYAIEVGCKHQTADLTKGKRNGMVFTCPRHDWVYDLETGECTSHESPKLRRHDVKLEGDTIKISMFPIEEY